MKRFINNKIVYHLLFFLVLYDFIIESIELYKINTIFNKELKENKEFKERFDTFGFEKAKLKFGGHVAVYDYFAFIEISNNLKDFRKQVFLDIVDAFNHSYKLTYFMDNLLFDLYSDDENNLVYITLTPRNVLDFYSLVKSLIVSFVIQIFIVLGVYLVV